MDKILLMILNLNLAKNKNIKNRNGKNNNNKTLNNYNLQDNCSIYKKYITYCNHFE